MTATPDLAQRRPAVWLISRGVWAELVFVCRHTRRCKVRTAGGYFMVPGDEVEVPGG